MMKRILVVSIAVLLFLPACKDDKPPCLECPATGPSRATLDNIWPNEDQTSWTYAYTWKELNSPTLAHVYETPENIPQFTWDDMRKLLESHSLKGPVTTAAAKVVMRFDGMATTESGVTGQNLTMLFDFQFTPTTLAYTANHTGVFLARRYAARPDLRAAIEREYKRSGLDAPARTEPFAQYAERPLFLHDGVWEKTEEWIGGYGDLNQSLAWEYLGADLSVGSEFSLRLVPDLADDVYLHCRVEGSVLWRSGVGRHSALDVYYIVDYGIGMATDEQGAPLGYVRLVDCGRVVYAPNIGPIYLYEIGLIEPGDPPSNGMRTIEMTIAE